ncbi:hypothetical protein CJ030_MR8G020614 [Morella rubra]|uniref:Uncharacterized protein n=1 Tax=Morella rubra TaxID=262757 RepID=A0A6A1UWC4_9ROSI|nr:hypothetical protein CJ030_MR8G020614 [Morella rubra]
MGRPAFGAFDDDSDTTEGYLAKKTPQKKALATRGKVDCADFCCGFFSGKKVVRSLAQRQEGQMRTKAMNKRRLKRPKTGGSNPVAWLNEKPTGM